MSHHPPKISIIIPSYNYGHFLSRTVQSVIAQNYPEMEIIVIDDGSVDETALILEPYLNRINYIHQPNLGLSEARNTGIKASTGDYVLFLDADDLLDTNTLTSQQSYLQYNGHVDISVCKSYFFTNDAEIGSPYSLPEWRLFEENLDSHLCHFNIAPPHAYLMRRTVLDNVGFFDLNLFACEDYDFWFRCMMSGHAFKANPGTCVFYRKHGNSMSSNLDRQWRHDAIMHHRVFHALMQGSTFSGNQLYLSWMANIAGAMFTVTRLSHDIEAARNLMVLIEKSLFHIQANPGSVVDAQEMLGQYFRLRILLSLLSSDFRKIAASNDIVEKVYFVFPEIHEMANQYQNQSQVELVLDEMINRLSA